MSYEKSLHHESGRLCALCDSKLFGAHPYLRSWFRQAKEQWINLHVCWAFRSERDQNKMCADGLTKKKWPDSAHNNMELGNPVSHALDVFQIDEDGVARFAWLFYRELYKWSNRTDFYLRWGGNFKDIGDADHFEMDMKKVLTVAALNNKSALAS